VTPFVDDADFTLYVGDVREVLAELPAASVNCCVTSPPYWGLRDYGTGEWDGGDPDCDHDTIGARGGRGGSGAPGKQTEGAFPDRLAADVCSCGAVRVDQQIGLEPTPDAYVAAIVDVFREVRRVLSDDGTLFLNLGDSYASQPISVQRMRTDSRSARSGQGDVPSLLSPDGEAPVERGALRAGEGEGSRVPPSEQGSPQRPDNSETAQHANDDHRDVGGALPVLRGDGTSFPDDRPRSERWSAGPGEEAASRLQDHSRRGLPAEPLSDPLLELQLREGRPGSLPSYGDLKPKDLVGIPWKVARALQEPYYTGTIKDERERVWLAAMIDAEGCIFVHKRKAGTDSGAKFTKADGTERSYARTQDTYGSGLEISNTSRAVVERALAIVGKGSISESTRGRNQPLYRWNLRTNECRDVLREVYPHLVAKQHQARIAIGCPASGDNAALAHSSLIALHSGAAATIDFPAPATLYEQGWYLRSDVIWSKSNPMPESVADRPTKAHEYVFLLSKSPRYYFDQEAVREPHAPDGRRKTTISGTNPGITGHENHANREGHDRWPGAGRNIRSVWEIATQPYPEAHFATFSEELPRRCIAAGCPEWVCRICGKARERIVERETVREHGGTREMTKTPLPVVRAGWREGGPTSETVGWSECACGPEAGKYVPGVVLDPFMGSGTTALVARKLGRRAVGVELSPEYAALCAKRLQQQSLFA